MKTKLPFLIATLAWAAVAAIFCMKMAHFHDEAVTSLKWFAGLSLLSLLDLAALTQVMKGALALMEETENRFFSALRTSYWGSLKLACIVIFGIIFWKIGNSRAAVPASGLLAGISTLVVVPVLGGLIQHFLNDESLKDSRESSEEHYGRARI
jgi:hypothetical protein